MPRTSTSDLKPRRPKPSTKATRAKTPRALIPETKLMRPKRGADKPQTAVSKGARNLPSTANKAGAEQVDPDKPLTAKQLNFVRAWAAGESISSASQRAGYSAGDGFCYRMTHMPNVLKIYRDEKAKYEAALQMTRKKVMDMHLEAFEMAKLMSEPASMVSAAREIGRMCGYYEPVKHQIDVNVTGDVTVRQLNNMTDAELLRILQQSPVPLLERVDEPNDEAHA